jgi:DNA-binding NarL/FixJ family response regulator
MTPRERQVFAHLLRGFTNRQIARSLGISEQTVKNHLRSVFAKLGVADRLQAVLAVMARPDEREG